MLNPFSFFRDHGGQPPLDEQARVWIEQKLRWLGEEFGSERLLEAPVIEPSAEFFPDPYDASPASVRAMFERVCGYMEVSPAMVELQI